MGVQEGALPIEGGERGGGAGASVRQVTVGPEGIIEKHLICGVAGWVGVGKQLGVLPYGEGGGERFARGSLTGPSNELDGKGVERR